MLILPLLVLVGSLCAALWPWGVIAASDVDVLDVKAESGGGVRATAHVLFPAKPAIIQSLLTDYPRWPELFEVRMRVADLNVHEGVATVDLRITHALIPGERRLVTDSRTLPDGGLVTDLTGGDFKRYHRVWKLRPAGEGNQTSADFELTVELDSLTPDWLIAVVMRQELESHFRIVKQKALEQSRK
jgi:ribosome-associated toxin RatA of RatAB toxin-antitoxin module